MDKLLGISMSPHTSKELKQKEKKSYTTCKLSTNKEIFVFTTLKEFEIHVPSKL